MEVTHAPVVKKPTQQAHSTQEAAPNIADQPNTETQSPVEQITSALAEQKIDQPSPPVAPTTVYTAVSPQTVESTLRQRKTQGTGVQSHPPLYRNVHYPSVEFIRHQVSPEESLTDLAVRYGVTPAEIRRYNRRVVFEWLDNVNGEFIHIPVPASRKHPDALSAEKLAELEEQAVLNRRENMVTSFMLLSGKETHGQGCAEEEAQFYLEENAYDLDKALQQYRQDLEWERVENAFSAAKHAPFTAQKTGSSEQKSQKPQKSHAFAGFEGKESALLAGGSKPKTSTAQALRELAEARQAKLTGIVAAEEKRRQAEKELARIQKREQELERIRREMTARPEREVPLLATPHPDSEGFYAVASVGQIQEESSSTFCGLGKSQSKPTISSRKTAPINQQMVVSDSSFI